MSTSSPATQPSDTGWHLQILRAEWVLWGYGPRAGAVTVERASLELAPGLDLPFELPAAEEGAEEGAPTEYERKIAVGWRLCPNSGMPGAAWRLADTEEQAIADARAWVEKRIATIAAGLEDIRRG